MERGLLWLPLLFFFIWLAWSGWNEYQKVEAYRLWAEQFEQAKYDIYSVLGKKGTELTWGKPTRKGPIELNTFSLNDISDIRVLMNDRPIDLDNPQGKGKSFLEFSLTEQDTSLKIPFTDVSLAAKWGKYLSQEWQKLQTNS
jgi:hypothetical protein